MTQMHAHTFRISVNPASILARLRRLAGPAHHGLLTAAVMLTTAGTARAAGSSMPWEGPLESILESIQGPVARIVAVIIIIAIFFWGTALDGLLGMVLAIPLTAFFVTAWLLLKKKYFASVPPAVCPTRKSPASSAP